VNQKIHVITKAQQFEKRKQEHLQAGYQIEDEQSEPINGLCSFTAVRVVADGQDFDFDPLSPADRTAADSSKVLSHAHKKSLFTT
jgi:hypothetical protein